MKSPLQYRLTDSELRAVQMVGLEMLIEVDRICKKNNIKYFLDAGTALGAVRHGGFIPWDDDIDLGFLRSEYEKFRKVVKTDLDTTRFYFQDYRKTKGYRWGHGKIRRKGTKFMRLNQEHLPYGQGIFLDLWPYDGVPDTPWLRPMHSFCCFLFRKATYSKVGVMVTQGLKKMMYAWLQDIPENVLYKNFNTFVKMSNLNKSTKYVRTLTFPMRVGSATRGYLRQWLTDLTEINFEGYSFPIPKDYDNWLTFRYGGYMVLPDEKDRKPHPVSELKLL
ncbi:MAG: LicD family protein [Defluviitaleaceae bacterium]|nr:LicD family protein [Defluviitaleaceae bacterium]MCL2274429.1 LicD family protein [Defluviitaleaceae bacterium]